MIPFNKHGVTRRNDHKQNSNTPTEAVRETYTPAKNPKLAQAEKPEKVVDSGMACRRSISTRVPRLCVTGKHALGPNTIAISCNNEYISIYVPKQGLQHENSTRNGEGQR